MSDLPANRQDLAALDALASTYLVRLLAEPDDSEKQAIYDWIDADPQHAIAFCRLQAAWDASERLRASPPPLDLPKSRPVNAWSMRRGLIGGLVAAGALGSLVAVGWIYGRNLDLYRTGVGQQKTIVLSDGSSVELNTASAIEVSMRKNQREVRLVRGEAQFKVAHDAARPFLVDAGSAQLRAVGTAFNVRIRNDVVELTVTQGVVAVASSTKKAADGAKPRIAAGDGAVIGDGAIAPIALGDTAVSQRTAWQRGVIELQGETLSQVVDEFNRYQTQPIIIGDARLANIRMGGRFQIDEASKFLAAISSSFPIDVIHTRDGGVLLAARRSDSFAPQ